MGATIAPMPTREEILREKTHKEDDLPIGKRVFYTLTGERETAKCLALLVETLHARAYLSYDEIDDMLLAVVAG